MPDLETVATFSEEERMQRDEVAARILAALLPHMPGPSAAASAMSTVFELAEFFVIEARRRGNVVKVEKGAAPIQPSLLVKS